MENRFLTWPVAWAVCVPIAIVLMWAFFPFIVYIFFGVPIAIVLWFVTALFATCAAVAAAQERAWIRSLSAAILPLAVIAAALQPLPFLHLLNSGGDIIHFELMRPFYLARIALLPADEPRLVVFGWGVWIAASRGVVFDESDEIQLSPKRQSDAWKRRAGNTELACGGYSIQPLGAHFYQAEFPC